MKLVPWMVLLSLGMTGCSGSKSAQRVNEETPQIELSDAEDIMEPTETEQAPTEAPAEATLAEEPTEEIPEDVVVSNSEPLVEESSLESSSSTVPTGLGGGSRTYSVQKNETLMMIAFKIYGDYGRWKELANMNSGVLKGSSTVRAGTSISYNAPAEEFVWNPQGNPYLIKTGDTLGIIAKDVYATPKKWKLLWENNRPLIRDPNKIFAGFTIYYLENGREVASKK